MADIKLADSNSTNSDMNIDILIGADYYWSFMTGKARQSSLGPTVVESILEWVLSGKYETNVRPTSRNFVNFHVLKFATELSLNTKLELKLKQFWEYEGFNTNTNTNSSDFNLKKFKSNLKILLQKLCVLKVNWDDPILTNLALEWKNLLTE